MTAGPGTRSLRIRGSFRGLSGHDHHTREFARQLARLGVRVQLTDLPQWHPVKLAAHARDPWFEQLDDLVDAAATLQFCMPHQVVTEPGRLTVNYTMFEACPAPADWIARGSAHDLVVVPTESSREAWLAGGHPPEAIRTCPLGADLDRFAPGVPPLALDGPGGRPVASYRVRVLNVCEPQPRKNLMGLVRTWITTTSAADDAILIVKLTLSSRRSASDLVRQLAGLELGLGRGLREAAPVLFTDRLFGEDEMPGLYTAATHYWSMSCGEGWDLPMTEAAAAGLRLIAPRHSAYLAYLDDSVAQLVPSRPVPAETPGDPWIAELFAGAQWWQPDPDAAAQALRNAIDGRDQPAASARDRLAASFTWPQSAARLTAILAGLHAEHGRRF
jgi:glycosyltransferase involved in cell wall biosynthesis